MVRAKTANLHAAFFERFGGYYDGTLNEFRVRANYRPTARSSVSVSQTWDRFLLPLPNGNFSVLQGNYSFNRFLTFTSLIKECKRCDRAWMSLPKSARA